MRNNNPTILTVQKGRFQGKEFRMENDIVDMPRYFSDFPNDLPTLATGGNWAAINAIKVDGYKVNDAPFYYGKIGSLGYIISHEDLYGARK